MWVEFLQLEEVEGLFNQWEEHQARPITLPAKFKITIRETDCSSNNLWDNSATRILIVLKQPSSNFGVSQHHLGSLTYTKV